MAFVLTERFSTGINNILKTEIAFLLEYWDIVEEINTFIRNQEAKDLIIIDLNPFVCLDENIPCQEKLKEYGGRVKDGVHYRDKSREIVA
jgi:hypothetical protein